MTRFQKAPLLKPFFKVFVFISVFGRSSVDGRQKRNKKYAFLMYGCEEIECDHSNESH